MFVEGIYITGTLNTNNLAVSVVNYSSNIYHVSESSSNGDLLNTDDVRCRYGIGRVVTGEDRYRKSVPLVQRK